MSSREDRRTYLTPVEPSSVELREKGSRFLGILLPARSEDDVKRLVEEVRIKYRDATHHCWASRLGHPPRERSADAGEPAGTAGAPILQVLAGRDLSDVLAVVVRWFGGTKLGKGGLARAYSGATSGAVDAARFHERFPTARLRLEMPYDRVGAVKRLVQPPEVELESETYGESARVELRVAEWREQEVRAALADLGIAAESH
ncbi:MAG: IMPACT family protein [Acidobacteriota bacterium]|nr:IMPACT family protein [Acidobacteriota bacterium]